MDTPHFVYPMIIWWTFGVVSSFWLLMLLWAFMYKSLCTCFHMKIYVFNPLGYIPGNEIAGSHDNSNILKNCQFCLTKWLLHFTFPPAMFEGSNFSTSSPTLVIFHHYYFYYYYSHSSRYEVVSHCGFDSLP